MKALTHEQFSVAHGHKIITQFINKMINVNEKNKCNEMINVMKK